MALSVMDEPQVGPTVVMLMTSAWVWGTPLFGAVVAVVAVVVLVLPVPVVLVVVAAAVVEVVVPEAGGFVPVSLYMAFCTLVLTFCCCSADSLLRSSWTLSVCLLPVPRSSTVGSTNPVPLRASVAWVWV